MTLTIRNVIVLSCIGLILLLGNVLAVANWLAEKGVVDKANWIREEFLTGMAIAVIIALLTLICRKNQEHLQFVQAIWTVIWPFVSRYSHCASVVDARLATGE